jgi:hypothetical protein
MLLVSGTEHDAEEPGYTVRAESREEAQDRMRRRFLREFKQDRISLPEKLEIDHLQEVADPVEEWLRLRS